MFTSIIVSSQLQNVIKLTKRVKVTLIHSRNTHNFGICSRGRCLCLIVTELLCSLSYMHSILHRAGFQRFSCGRKQNVMDISCAKPKIFVLARGAHFDPSGVKNERLFFVTFPNYTHRPFQDKKKHTRKQNYLRGQYKFPHLDRVKINLRFGKSWSAYSEKL